MPVAYADAIRRAADLLIGENLTCPMCCAREAIPVDIKALPGFARAAISNPGHRKNTHPMPPRCAF
jgi:hypothetical protein